MLARDESRGQDAVAAFAKEGLHPKYHQLDIDDEESIKRLRQFLVDNYGGLDLLVNNAGIAYKVRKIDAVHTFYRSIVAMQYVVHVQKKSVVEMWMHLKVIFEYGSIII